MGSTFIGIIIIICASFLYDKKLLDTKIYTSDIHTPVLVMLIGLLFQALQRVYEEYLILKVETSTYRFVGLEGFFGLAFTMFFQFIFVILQYNYQQGSKAYDFVKNINGAKTIVLISKSNLREKIKKRCKYCYYYNHSGNLNYSLRVLWDDDHPQSVFHF